MKKFIGPICSFVTGVFVFVFLSIANLVSTASYNGVSNSTNINAWDIMKDSADIKGYGLFKVSAIFLIIVACLLIVSGIILILKNYGILKSKFNFTMLNNILLSVFAFFTILALISLFIMSGEISTTVMGMQVSATAGIGAWLNVIFGAVACALGWISARKNS